LSLGVSAHPSSRLLQTLQQQQWLQQWQLPLQLGARQVNAQPQLQQNVQQQVLQQQQMDETQPAADAAATVPAAASTAAATGASAAAVESALQQQQQQQQRWPLSGLNIESGALHQQQADVPVSGPYKSTDELVATALQQSAILGAGGSDRNLRKANPQAVKAWGRSRQRE
jgi:hypothetical protein